MVHTYLWELMLYFVQRSLLRVETSLMLHYYPEMVRLDLIPDVKPAEFPPYDIYPYHIDMVPACGVLSSAKEASVEKGALIAAQISEHIAAAAMQEF